MDTWATLGAAAVLAVVPVLPRFVPRIGESRRRWAMSAAGGFAVAFVFLELLPQVMDRATPVSEEAGDALPFVEHEALFLVLVGLSAFYALERLALRSRERTSDESTRDPIGLVSIAAFAGYAAIIGYLLWAQSEEGTADLAVFTLAVALHFFVVDIGLEVHHRDTYRRFGRWSLSTAVLAGWAVGMVASVPEAMIGMLLSFVGGGVILITLKEELPSEKDGRVTAFVLGAAAFTALLAAG